MWSCYIAQAGLELEILLLLPPGTRTTGVCILETSFIFVVFSNDVGFRLASFDPWLAFIRWILNRINMKTEIESTN